tara:strand:- start:3260 stop:3742 length:483 start_codon:yes stop_codon:yes gene_type:complete
MIIEIREIPEDGVRLAGQIEEDIFHLDDKDLKLEGPISYDFFVSLVSGTLLVQGSVSTRFQTRCVRCLDPFVQEVSLPDCIFNEPIEGRATIDLTDSIREDILLALPIHPHCEQGSPPKDCPMSGKFEKPEEPSESAEDGAEPGNRDSWADLKGFKPQRD